MIVRILGEGQFELETSQAASLDVLDRNLWRLSKPVTSRLSTTCSTGWSKKCARRKPVAADRFVRPI